MTQAGLHLWVMIIVFHLHEVMTYGVGKADKERVGKETKTQQPSFPGSYPQVLPIDLGNREGLCWWGKGTLRQQTS